MKIGSFDHLRPPVEAMNYATAIGEMVALGAFTVEQGIDLVYLWPGPPGTRILYNPRIPLRPRFQFQDATGCWCDHGLHTQLCWAMRDSASRMAGELGRQELAARKILGPMLASGAGRANIIAAISKRCPDLPETTVMAVISEEGFWWMRWQHEHGFGDQSGTGEFSEAAD